MGTMELTATHVFAAPPEAVHAMMTDQAFLTHAAAASGAESRGVQATPTRTESTMLVAAPPEVRAFVGSRLTLRQTMEWGPAAPDGSRQGSLAIDVADTPVTVRARTTLRPTASGSRLEYDGHLEVNVPLLGRTIEKQAAPPILAALHAQQRIGADWLARGQA